VMNVQAGRSAPREAIALRFAKVTPNARSATLVHDLHASTWFAALRATVLRIGSMCLERFSAGRLELVPRERSRASADLSENVSSAIRTVTANQENAARTWASVLHGCLVEMMILVRHTMSAGETDCADSDAFCSRSARRVRSASKGITALRNGVMTAVAAKRAGLRYLERSLAESSRAQYLDSMRVPVEWKGAVWIAWLTPTARENCVAQKTELCAATSRMPAMSTTIARCSMNVPSATTRNVRSHATVS